MSIEANNRTTDAQSTPRFGEITKAEISVWHDLAQDAYASHTPLADRLVAMPEVKAPVSVDLVAAASNLARDARLVSNHDAYMSHGYHGVISEEVSQQGKEANRAQQRIDLTLKNMTAEEQSTALALADKLLRKDRISFVFKGTGDLELVNNKSYDWR